MDPSDFDPDEFLKSDHADGCQLTESIGHVWDGWRSLLDHAVPLSGTTKPDTLAWADMTHEEQHEIAATMMPGAGRNIAAVVALSRILTANRRVTTPRDES